MAISATETGNGLTRGHKKKERTFNQILNAAHRVFIRKGVDLTAISDIRDEAGISQGTFYNYFRTKQDVLAELGARVTQYHKEKIFAISDRYDDPAERFAVFAKLWLDLARHAPDTAGIVAQAGDRMIALNRQMDLHLMAYLESGVESGRFEVSADQTTLDIVRSLGFSGIRLVLNGDTDSSFDTAFVALFLRALGLPSQEAEEIASRPAPKFPIDEVQKKAEPSSA
jgi:AcrR family transcriptional regulator